MRTSGASWKWTGRKRRAGVVRRALAVVAAASVGMSLSMSTAMAADDPAAELQSLKEELSAQVAFGPDNPTDQLMITDLAAATPDECYKPGGTYEPAIDNNGVFTCPDGSGRQLKVNQGYVWGMAKQGDTLWFGTGPNVQCLMMAQYIAPIPLETDAFVCDPFSTYRAAEKAVWTGQLATYLIAKKIGNPLDAGKNAGNTIARIGDWRTPDLFTYDLDTGTQTNLSDRLDADGTKWLGRTLGIRSAGSTDEYVIFAGPDVLTAPNGAWGWVNYFVFDRDGNFVGSDHVEGQTNIRKWVDINGKLYTGVGKAPTFKSYAPDPANPVRGEVLKFTGFDATDPEGSRIKYEVVGNMTTSPSEFTEFNNRIYTSSWPVGTSPDTAGIYMSPELNGDGELTSNTAWDKVWDIKDYEPDPVVARTMAVGPVQAYEGKIYWGTMNVPFVGSFYLIQAYTSEYGAPDTEQLALMALGGWRTTSLFRGDSFDTSADVQLLYGNVVLPVLDMTGPTASWSLQRNAMNAIPRYGLAGFGNPFNAYTWTMAVNRGDLYAGTFDSSYLIRAIVEGLLQSSAKIPEGVDATQAQTAASLLTPENIQTLLEGYGLTLEDFPLQYGADLWRFPTGNHRAVPEFINGGQNRYSYGIRTMISDGTKLYLGMANPMNLEVNPPGEPQGGWQLLELSPWPTQVKLFAEPNSAAVGEPVTFDVSVRPDLVRRSLAHGTPWGILKVYGDDLLLGSCQVFQGRGASCEMTTSALTAGAHTFYATFDGTRTWASSRSKDVLVTIGAPADNTAQTPQTAPAAPAPQSPSASGGTPQIAATSISVGARAQTKALKPLRTTTLVKSVQTNASSVGVRVQCVVDGKVLKGKAARKACGITVVKGKAVKVTASPKCVSAQIKVALTAQAQGAATAQWTRTWSVSKKCKS